MKTIKLDEKDITILRACRDKTGSSIAEIVDGLEISLTKRSVYYRFQRLQRLGLVRFELCHITPEGKEILAGKDSDSSPSGDERLGQ